MKKIIALGLVITLVCSVLASCGTNSKIEYEDTWFSSEIAPLTYFVDFTGDNKIESEYNNTYEAAVENLYELTMELYNKTTKAYSKVDTLEEKYFEFVDETQKEHSNIEKQSQIFLSTILSKRAMLDGINISILDIIDKKSDIPLENAIYEMEKIHQILMFSEILVDYTVSLIDYNALTLELINDDITKKEERESSDFSSYFESKFDENLENIIYYSSLIQEAFMKVENSQQYTTKYCSTESVYIIDDIKNMVSDYDDESGEYEEILKQCNEDMDFLMSVINNDDVDIYQVDTTNSPLNFFITTVYAENDNHLNTSISLLEDVVNEKYENEEVDEIDFLEVSKKDAKSNVDNLDSSSQKTPSTEMSKASQVAYKQIDSLNTSENAINTNKANSNNSVNILEKVRNYQDIVKQLLDPKSRTGIGGFFANIFVPSVDLDTVLNTITVIIPSLVAGREDADNIIAYSNNNIKMYIKNALGDNWKDFFNHITSMPAEELTQRYIDWFNNSDNQNSFIFSEDEILALIASFSLPYSMNTNINTDSIKSTDNSQNNNSGGSSVPASVNGKFDYIVTAKELENFNSDMSIENIMSTAFGWSASYGDAIEKFDLGWYYDDKGRKELYVSDDYSFEVNYMFGEGNTIQGISSTYFKDGSYWYLKYYKENGKTVNELNSYFFKLEFNNDGYINKVFDYYSITSNDTYAKINNGDSATGLKAEYRNGKVTYEYGFMGNDYYSKAYYENGEVREKRNYIKVEHQIFLDGKYVLTEREMENCPEEYYSLYAADGDYYTYNDKTVMRTHGQYVLGEATGMWLYYNDSNKLIKKQYLVNDIRNGEFVLYSDKEAYGYHIKAAGYYLDDLRTGEWKFYNMATGIQMNMITYVAGHPKGTAQTYTEGVLSNEGSFENGKASSIWKRFDENGNFIKEESPYEAYIFTHELDEFIVYVIVRY